MATFIKRIESDPRKNAVIEFTPHELDVLLDICYNIGGNMSEGSPHYIAENILLPVLLQAGAIRRDFPKAFGKESLYYAN